MLHKVTKGLLGKMSKINEIVEKIAQLTFKGEHMEARQVFKKWESELKGLALFRSRFHIGLSYTRTSEYEKAKEIFLQSYREWLRARPTGAEGFYVFQGLSFFRFFFSRHQSSLTLAKKALALLQMGDSKDALPFALVYDLLSHNFFQLGEASKGEENLLKAIEAAKKGGLHSLEGEFRASLVIYKSNYSTEIETSLRSLKKLLKNTPETNDYTLSEIVLQITKLLLLKGQYKKANEFLISHFKVIYKNENKRKVAKLNTLLAILMREKGQYIEALSLLKVAKKNLVREVDMNLLIPCLGLEVELLGELKQDSEEEKEELLKALRRTDKSIPHRIELRISKGQNESFAEDPLGNLFDQLRSKNQKALDEALNSNLYHLAKTYFPKTKSPRAIFIHPLNSGFLISSEDESFFIESKLSKNQLSLIRELGNGPQTKEELVTKVWGYDYDPLRHDHLVYSAIRRMRVALGKFSFWITSDENHYSWEGSVEIIFPQSEKAKKPKPSPSFSDSEWEELNFRQVQILEGAFDKPFSAGEHAEFFGINRMTSFRDLRELVEANLLVKRGRGKGTQYFLN